MRLSLAVSLGVARHLRFHSRAYSLATLALVMLPLGWVQYHWIDEVSQAQETREGSRLSETVRLVSDALDTEIARAALVFTFFPVPPASAYEALGQRWATWNHDAHWPRILLGVAVAELTDAGWRAHWLGDSGRLEVQSILPAAMIHDPPPPGATSSSHAEIRIPDLFLHGQPYLLRPIPTLPESAGSPRMSWVIVHYNLGYLAETVFPQLLAKYSTGEDRVDYRFRIGPHGLVPPGTLTAAGLLHYRPDCLMPEGIGEPAISVSAFRNRPAGALARSANVGARFTVARSIPPYTLLHAIGQCQMPASASNPGLLQLSVYRPRGTLADVYIGFRRRNEILSSLVLVVLLAALAALVFSAERARRLARLQTVVAAGISHELRSPLASLNVAADHLKNGHVENIEQARRYGEIIEAQSRRLRHVVDQALSLTGLARWNRLPNPRLISLAELIHSGIEGLLPRLKEAGIRIECHTAPDLPMMAADPDLILRCLVNLVENSIKYGRSGGWIQVSASRGRNAGRPVVELAVEDRGPGIPDDEAAAVFEPFYRGSAARQSRQPGSGLGLAIVKSAVEAHGGWIRLERAVPHGSTFRLFFPAACHHDAVHSPESRVQHDAIPTDTAG